MVLVITGALSPSLFSQAFPQSSGRLHTLQSGGRKIISLPAIAFKTLGALLALGFVPSSGCSGNTDQTQRLEDLRKKWGSVPPKFVALVTCDDTIQE